MQALSQLSEAAMGEPSLATADLPAGLADALRESGINASSLSPEMLEKLAESMSQRGDDLKKMIEALQNAGLAEGAGTGETKQAIDPSELLDWLAGEGQCDAAGVVAICRVGGRGDVNRGPGHAEMIWGDESSKEGVSFDPELLPPARLQEMRDAELIGTSRGNPQPAEDVEGSAGGALGDAEAGGGSASTSTVLPRHRAAVQRYFERDSR